MMCKKAILTLALGLITSMFYCSAKQTPSQINEESLSVLDKTSSLYKDKGDMEIRMKILFKDAKTKSENSSSGNMKSKGRKFLLATDFATLLYDGKYMYVYSPSNEEITISEPDSDDVSSMDPTSIFEMYKNNFKIPAPEKIKSKGKEYYSINLFPENLNADYVKLNINVSAEDFSIASVSTQSKNGITNTIEIDSITTGKDFAEGMFVFDAAKYPNATIIDLR